MRTWCFSHSSPIPCDECNRERCGLLIASDGERCILALGHKGDHEGIEYRMPRSQAHYSQYDIAKGRHLENGK